MKTWKAGELREDMLVVPAHVVQTKYATIDREELREIQSKANRYDEILPFLILVAGSDKVDPDCCIAYWRGELRALLNKDEK